MYYHLLTYPCPELQVSTAVYAGPPWSNYHENLFQIAPCQVHYVCWSITHSTRPTNQTNRHNQTAGVHNRFICEECLTTVDTACTVPATQYIPIHCTTPYRNTDTAQHFKQIFFTKKTRKISEPPPIKHLDILEFENIFKNYITLASDET